MGTLTRDQRRAQEEITLAASRRLGYDERVHKDESVARMAEARFS